MTFLPECGAGISLDRSFFYYFFSFFFTFLLLSWFIMISCMSDLLE